MSRRLERKWRPALGLVLGGTLAVTLCLPLAGILAVRAVSPLLGYTQAVIVVGLTVVAATAGLGWLLWRLLFGPIRTLARRARLAKAGAAGAFGPVPHYGTAEMRDLGRAMLEMGRVLQGREAVLRSYADHVTHELKSPLTVLRGAAELLVGGDLPEAERQRLLARVGDAADRMTALLDAQRALARAQEPLAAGETAVAALLPELRRDHPGLVVELVQAGTVPLPELALRPVLDHLLGNAAAHGARRVCLSVDGACLSVADDGPGISVGNRDRVFDPFFTTRRVGGGTGMGLPIVRRILEAHDAGIRLSEAMPGATFVIEF